MTHEPTEPPYAEQPPIPVYANGADRHVRRPVLCGHLAYPDSVSGAGGQPFIHFGNMVTILAALLIGGWQGGLSGSIGMGLFDIVGGYGIDSLKTFILKFGIGLFTGLVARIGRRHPERNPRVGLGVAGGISLALGLTVLIGKLRGLVAPGQGGGYFLCAAADHRRSPDRADRCRRRTEKLTNETLFAALGATAGIAFNVVGEFIGGGDHQGDKRRRAARRHVGFGDEPAGHLHQRHGLHCGGGAPVCAAEGRTDKSAFRPSAGLTGL